MSTYRPTQNDSPTAGTRPTEIAARGGADPWADETATDVQFTAARAPRQFEPTRLERLRNLMDDENAYCD